MASSNCRADSAGSCAFSGGENTAYDDEEEEEVDAASVEGGTTRFQERRHNLARPSIISLALVGNYSRMTCQPVWNNFLLRELMGRSTYKLNLSGNVVLPGFIDSHVLLIDGGLQLARVPLRGVRSKDIFIRRVKEAVRGSNELYRPFFQFSHDV